MVKKKTELDLQIEATQRLLARIKARQRTEQGLIPRTNPLIRKVDRLNAEVDKTLRSPSLIPPARRARRRMP